MRKTTERTEGVEAGCSRLVGTERRQIVRETARVLNDRGVYEAMIAIANPYGDGKAAARIRQGLAFAFGLSLRRPGDFRRE